MSNSAAGSADRILLQRSIIDVRWGDMDAFNHVNNATYLRYIEQARIEWFETMGSQWLTDTIAPIMAAANINYRRPIEYPARIAVELFADKIGNTSVTLGHLICDSEDTGTVYADGNVVVVWIDRALGKSIALPDFVRERCAGDVA